jgi:hypothetical protein
LGGVFWSFRGWQSFYYQRKLLGTAQVSGGLLIGALGLGLLFLTAYPSTWEWLL